MLAKASGLAGALLVGVAVGLLVYAVSAPAASRRRRFWPDVLLGIGVGSPSASPAWIVEWWCHIPPQDRADTPDRTLEQR